jgi:hypothetical protein
VIRHWAPALAIVATAPASVSAQELPVRFEGRAPPGVEARVRSELEALGHTTSRDESRAAVLVRFDVTRAEMLVAVVLAPGRSPARVEVDARDPEATALFALRVSEAVRASVLRPPTEAPRPPVVAPPTIEFRTVPAAPERMFSAGLGVRALASPGGVDPMLLPWVHASMRFGLTRVNGLVEVGFAGPSFFGDAGAAARLGVIEVSVGAGVSIAAARSLRVDATARLSYAALRLDVEGGVQSSARDGQWAASAVAAVRWALHDRIEARAGASLGATLGGVDLGIGARTVAEWGRPVAGLEVGVEARF